MATLTQMAFRISSTYNGNGLRAARRDIEGLDGAMRTITKSTKSLAPGMQDLVATALALGPALVPITGGLIGIGAAAGSAFASAGSAIGIYGLAMKGAIQSTVGQGSAVASTATKMQTAQKALDGTTKGTKEYDKALKKLHEAEKAHEAAIKSLPPVQEAFARAFDNAKASIDNFNDSNAKFTLRPATTMINAFIAALPKVTPLLRAMEPEVQAIADATMRWVKEGGLDRFISFLVKNGVPAFHGFATAVRDMLGALGIGMRQTAPLGAAFVKWLMDVMAGFKAWAEGGGFQRFLEWLRANSPALIQAAKDLGTFLGNVGKSLGDMSGSAFIVFGTFLKVLASFPPGLLTAMAYGFIAVTAAMKVYAAVMLIVGIYTAATALATSGLGVILLGIISTVAIVVAAIVAIGVAIYFIVKYWDQISAAFKTAWEVTWNAIKVAFEAVWNAIKTAALAVWDFLTNGWGQFLLLFMGPVGLLIALVANWDAIWGAVKSIALTVWGALQTAWSATVGGLKDAWDAVIAPIVASWNTIWPQLQLAAENVWNAIRAKWDLLWALVTAVWNAFWSVFGPVFTTAWSGLVDTAQAIWAVFTTAWSAIWTTIQGIFNVAWAILSGAWSIGWTFLTETAKIAWAILTGAWSVVWSVVTGIWNTFYATFSAIFAGAWNVIVAIVTGIWNVIKAAWQALWATVTAIFMTFLAIFTGNWGAAWNSIKDAAIAIWNLIKAAWQAFWNTMTAIFNAVVAVIKAAWSAFWTAIQATATTFWNALKTLFQTFLTAIQTLWNTVWTAVRTIFQTIINAILAAGQAWWNTIKALFQAGLTAVQSVWNSVWTAIRTFFTTISSGLIAIATGMWNGIKDLSSAFSSWLRTTFWNPVRDFFTKTIPGAFDTAKAAIGKAWDGIKKLVRDPIQAIVNVVYNNGIVKLWNTVAGVFGGKKLGTFSLPAFEQGGPTGMGSKKGFPAIVHPGEHVWTSAEVKAAGGHREVARLRAEALGRHLNQVRIFGGPNGRYDDGGGIFGTGFGPDIGPDIVGGVKSAIGKLKDAVLGGVYKVISGPINAAVKAAQSAVRGIIPGSPMLEDVAVSIPRKLADMVLNWIKDKDVAPEGSGSPMVGKIPTGQHLAIINAALKAAGVPPPGTLAQWQKGLNTLITRESGWNASAQNNWDSNAAAGMSSRGLAQVIPPTFASNHVAGTSNNIFDPVANVAAAIRYITRRYGNITNVQQANASLPPKGYALGTPGANSGWATVGEYGPERMRMRGGERIDPLQDLIRRGGGGGADVQVTVYAPGATHAVVDRLNTELPVKLRMALEQGTGKRP